MLLFDVNVLIALGDRDHQHRVAAEKALAGSGTDGWATCPLTENAFLRIVGHPNYPKGPGSLQKARRLSRFTDAVGNHSRIYKTTTFPNP